MKFSIKDFFSKCDQFAEAVDLVTFTAEILNRKLHSFCSVKYGELHNSLQHSLDYKFRKTVDQF